MTDALLFMVSFAFGYIVLPVLVHWMLDVLDRPRVNLTAEDVGTLCLDEETYVCCACGAISAPGARRMFLTEVLCCRCGGGRDD